MLQEVSKLVSEIWVPHIENAIWSSTALDFVITNGNVFRCSPATKILLHDSLIRNIIEYSPSLAPPLR